jgi:hypothetical protein
MINLADKHHIISHPDQYISAEIPDGSNITLKQYAMKHIIQGPCGSFNNAPCIKDGLCIKGVIYLLTYFRFKNVTEIPEDG